MIRILFDIFLIVHGVIHAMIWLLPAAEKAPFNPKHSWLFNAIGLSGDFVRIFAIVASIIAALTLISGSIGLLIHQGWGPNLVLVGAIVSMLLIVVYFNAWMSLAILLDIGIIYLVAVRHWPGV